MKKNQETVLDIGFNETLLLPARIKPHGGFTIAPKFAKADIHPYNEVTWGLRDIVIFDYATNKPSFSRNNVEAPTHWAENAVRITASKYLFGSTPNTPEYEDSLRHPFDRIANTYTIWAWKNGYLAKLEDARALNWELKAMLVNQIWAPNSPVWFNIGHWEQHRWGRPNLQESFKHKGNKSFKAFPTAEGLEVKEISNSYAHPQSSACFLTEVEDSMESILFHQITEGRIFASGSGVGLNLSKLRSSFEPISGRGRSSGPLSFDKGWDRMAGAIKSGGRCLAPWQQIYTEKGPRQVQDLAREGGHFVTLSFDPMANRIMAKPAQAWLEAIKEVVEIVTDKGTFALSTDHSIRTSDFQIIEAGKIKPGMHLHAGSIDLTSGYLRVHLQNGRKGKEKLHRLIAQDIFGDKIRGMHVHHIDGNKLNNKLDNLKTISPEEHHRLHSEELVSKGTHPFQLKKYSKRGEKNAMHHTSRFWTTKEAARYRKLQGKLLKESGRASKMQIESSKQRMLNLLWKTANEGGDISTFDSYLKSRTDLIGRIGHKNRLKAGIKKHFGSFEAMLEEMTAKNHTVISVRRLGPMETYNVEVTCPSPDDKTAASGHNFLLWDNNNSGSTGSGVFVLNSRRAARMVLMDSDHPNVFEFLNLKNSQEEIAKIILREHNVQTKLQQVAKEKLNKGTEAEKTVAQLLLGLPLVNKKDYVATMDGEVYGETISNQNSNHSISLKGDFWKAYNNNKDYATRWVTDPSHIESTFPAADLLNAMAESAWHNAEPGCHNSDFINLWNPVKSDGRINTSNPCSEYLFLNNTSCNLSSFNAYRFSKNGRFDLDLLQHGAFLAMMCADLNIEECGFPEAKIAEGTYTYRTTGIGYGNIGGLLMSLGIPYDSDEGRYIAALLASHLTSACWQASALLGRELGSYNRYQQTKNDLREVIRLHQACHHLLTKLPSLNKENGQKAQKDLITSLTEKFKPLPEADGITAADAMQGLLASFESKSPWDKTWLQFTEGLEADPWKGLDKKDTVFRNAFTTLSAPGGTISAPLGIYDEGTTSIEPDYTLVKYKALAGGGSITMFNSLALKGLQTLGYSPFQVKEAALEVAGINGLLVACNMQGNLAAQHLDSKVDDAQSGTVRQAYCAYPRPAEETTLAFLERADKSDLPQVLTNGVGHIENIPWLKPHHKAVFDCASTIGQGTRSIQPTGHIRMLGAIQPFLSGSSSKTVNLPHTATREDILNCFIESHNMGVKCIALYRDGSKGISVYSTNEEAKRWQAEHVWKSLTDSIQVKTQKMIAEASKPTRNKLPGRRWAQVVKFEIASQTPMEGFLIVGIYPNGTCGEVFGRLGQGGSFVSGMFEAFTKAFSVMLQWGVPFDQAINTFKHMAFDPSGWASVYDPNSPNNKTQDIKSCRSIIDLVMKILEWMFPPQRDFKIRDIQETPEIDDAQLVFETIDEDIERDAFKSAEQCPNCHALAYIQDGKCRKCRNCDYSSGGCG